MAATRRNMGVYQPRSRKAAFADALADARRTVARALRVAMVRAAGALVFLGADAKLPIGWVGLALPQRRFCCRPLALVRSPSSRRPQSGVRAR